MKKNISFKSFSPFLYIIIFSGLLWSLMFYAVGYSFYKIILIISIGVPITPLVWQFFGVYLNKLSRDRKLSQWSERDKV